MQASKAGLVTNPLFIRLVEQIGFEPLNPITSTKISFASTLVFRNEGGIFCYHLALLEGQVADHETRIDGLETNDTAQDSQLSDQEARITDLELQVMPSPGFKINAADGEFSGIIMGQDLTYTYPYGGILEEKFVHVFIPSLNTPTTIWTYKRSPPFSEIGRIVRTEPYFQDSDCSGTPYTKMPNR